MSLLQDVLRTQTLDSLDKTLAGTHISQDDHEDSEDELVNVVSMPGTPARSRPASRPASRATSPSRKGNLRGPLHLSALSSRPQKDPLRILPTDVSQRIFSQLSIKELAKCARVSRRWSKSQTLNYVWFQHYRKENFHDDTLPPGKWSKRESKENWRTTYLRIVHSRERSPTMYSRPLSPALSSGYQTPREVREERWKADADGQTRLSKNEMREMYKELGGRKARAKTKVGASGTRDRGGWEDGGDAGIKTNAQAAAKLVEAHAETAIASNHSMHNPFQVVSQLCACRMLDSGHVGPDNHVIQEHADGGCATTNVLRTPVQRGLGWLRVKPSPSVIPVMPPEMRRPIISWVCCRNDPPSSKVAISRARHWFSL
ncbi:hypothetical protein BC835DRAFT_1307061 [Cytidiella melzeri]|nr:hypothetical protein BC835DRAFT_1307061 [Cytidiella melzeri]